MKPAYVATIAYIFFFLFTRMLVKVTVLYIAIEQYEREVLNLQKSVVIIFAISEIVIISFKTFDSILFANDGISGEVLISQE